MTMTTLSPKKNGVWQVQGFTFIHRSLAWCKTLYHKSSIYTIQIHKSIATIKYLSLIELLHNQHCYLLKIAIMWFFIGFSVCSYKKENNYHWTSPIVIHCTLLWQIYIHFSTRGVHISQLDTSTWNSSQYTICLRFIQNVAQRACESHMELLNMPIHLKSTPPYKRFTINLPLRVFSNVR